MDILETDEFLPFTEVKFIRRHCWTQSYVGNNLLWGQRHWIDLERGQTYTCWADYLGPIPDLDSYDF